jgi:hypothetical protein
MLNPFEVELLNKLDRIIDLMRFQTDKMDQLHKLLNQYNNDYLKEMEKDGFRAT